VIVDSVLFCAIFNREIGKQLTAAEGADTWQEAYRRIWNSQHSSSRITSVITEPGRVIFHFQKTRKTGFACITLKLIMSSLGE